VARIVILGAGGQLGTSLARRLAEHSPTALDRAELDVGDPQAVDRQLGELRPEIVLNAAAFNDVDGAETQIDEAFRANAVAPWLLARASRACGALFVHFSTDYVFRGDALAPYGEDDATAPLGVYGASKLAGERLVVAANPVHMLIRTSAVFGRSARPPRRRNFIDTMVALAGSRPLRVVNDQRVSPTWSEDLAAKTVELVLRWQASPSADLLGLFHVTNSGSCTWHELACEALRRSGIDVAIEPITSGAYGARAPRPAYSVLAHRRLERLGIDDLPPWQEAVGAYLRGGT
jgi:dTDP-4-dehydrorhamnose reductase